MTDFNFHINTPRLTLSHFNPALDSHCDFLLALWTQPSALRATGGIASTNTTREKARNMIESEGDRIHPVTGHGRYLISLKTPPPPSGEADPRPFAEVVETYTKIGTVTMKTREYVDMPVLPDVGFGLLEEYEGKGYATEAAMALMKYLEEVKGQKEFIGLVHPDNERSIKMMKRLGFRAEGERGVLGITADGSVVYPLCWSKGVEGELPRLVKVQDA
jgi:RimJ/RimL family protein N-acetyltransferase